MSLRHRGVKKATVCWLPEALPYCTSCKSRVSHGYRRDHEIHIPLIIKPIIDSAEALEARDDKQTSIRGVDGLLERLEWSQSVKLRVTKLTICKVL